MISVEGVDVFDTTISVENGKTLEIGLSTENTPDIFLAKLPPVFSDIQVLEKNAECLFLPPRKPKIILCNRAENAIDLLFSAHINTDRTVVRTFSLEKTGTQKSFFRQKWDIAKQGQHQEQEREKGKKEVSLEANEDAASSSGESFLTLPKRRDLLLSDPVSRILTDKSSDFEIVARAQVGSDIQPVILTKATVSFFGDFSEIDRLALFASDGELLAETLSIDAAGNAFFDGFSAHIAEGGEFVFLGVKLLESKVGGSLSAHFENATAESYWNGERIFGGFTQEVAPVFEVATNKLVIQESENQGQILKVGRNEALKIRLDVLGGGEVRIHNLFVSLFKGVSEDGFSIDALRLFDDGKLVAKLIGGDLSGDQTLVLGDCADEICDTSSFFLSGETTFLLEANIATATGHLSERSTLNTEIRINGNKDGEDAVEWSDENGQVFRWIDRDEKRIETRIKNTLRNF